jgi:hypothetical protein
MDHQIKQARNVGLEILGLGGARIFDWGMNVGRHKGLAVMKGRLGDDFFAPAGLISRERTDVSSQPLRRAKKSGPARGLAGPLACVAKLRSDCRSGAGGLKNRANYRTDPSRLDP